MRIKQRLHFLVLMLTFSLGPLAQAQTPAPSISVRPMKNSDVLRMVQDGKKSGDIIAAIVTSTCNFDIFPPVLRDLKRRGVPDTVLLAMKMAPNGPPAAATDKLAASLTTPVKIPANTIIEVETAQAVSSAKVLAGSAITFLVSRRVFVNNVLVIERGAIAKATVVQVKRAATWGRPGMLAWSMDYVIGVDGTRIPLSVTGRQVGTNRSAAIAGGALATGALIFPYTSPVALIWGLKKGDEAVLRGSRVFPASVRAETEIAGVQPRTGGAIFHDQDTVKASAAPPTSTNFDRGGFKPRDSFRSRPNR